MGRGPGSWGVPGGRRPLPRLPPPKAHTPPQPCPCRRSLPTPPSPLRHCSLTRTLKRPPRRPRPLTLARAAAPPRCPSSTGAAPALTGRVPAPSSLTPTPGTPRPLPAPASGLSHRALLCPVKVGGPTAAAEGCLLKVTPGHKPKGREAFPGWGQPTGRRSLGVRSQVPGALSWGGGRPRGPGPWGGAQAARGGRQRAGGGGGCSDRPVSHARPT